MAEEYTESWIHSSFQTAQQIWNYIQELDIKYIKQYFQEKD